MTNMTPTQAAAGTACCASRELPPVAPLAPRASLPPAAPGERAVRLAVAGMTCAACVQAVPPLFSFFHLIFFCEIMKKLPYKSGERSRRHTLFCIVWKSVLGGILSRLKSFAGQ